MPIPTKVTIAALLVPVVATAGVVAVTGMTAGHAKTANAKAAAAQQEQIPFPALIHLPHYPLTPVQPSPKPVQLTGKGKPLKVGYTYNGTRRTLSDFLRRSSTLSFVVLRGNKVVDERYFEGQGPTSRFNTWSIGKSITATALGVALREGKIHALGDPVTRYVPELKGTGYDGVPLRDLLHMASGVKWDESNYFNFTTGATAAQLRLVFGTPMTKVAEEAVRERPSGTKWNYNSLDSFVLAWVLTKATGRSLASYVQEKIWKPAGMQSPLYLGKDWAGNGLGYCCYHATSRDLARFGLLYLNRGKANGRQVVPAGWVRDARVTAPYSRPEKIGQLGWGYGNQWWTAPTPGDYSANGVFGQYVYVSPRNGVVIVKTSQDIGYSSNYAELSVAFRAVANAVGAT
ncbi:serine hydrolase domain-containing protein [Spirillospora sp. CA-142024]|uniref:serine hydrolase domain-containing protein n=1 Tax=Spirillospora sp. CA-142024 TaxID=3240036 RepID=UPI003D8B13A0